MIDKIFQRNRYSICLHVSVNLPEMACPSRHLKYDDGLQCISQDNICDGYTQCDDKSDEDERKCLSIYM